MAGAVRIANVWLLRDERGQAFLIDTGHRLERRALLRWLRSADIRVAGDLTAILLTHRHSDHAGNAATLRERFACPVICHAQDAEALTGRRKPARLAGRGAARIHDTLCRIEDLFPARTPVDEAFGQGPFRWGFDVIHVGGHTRGSVLLRHGPTGTLFTGDALLAGPPAQRLHTRLRLAVPEYSLDAPRCHRAVRRYLRTQPRVSMLCTGHGPAVRHGLGTKLRRLLADTP